MSEERAMFEGAEKPVTEADIMWLWGDYGELSGIVENQCSVGEGEQYAKDRERADAIFTQLIALASTTDSGEEVMSEEIEMYKGADNSSIYRVLPMVTSFPYGSSKLLDIDAAISDLGMVCRGAGGINTDLIVDPDCRLELVFNTPEKAKQMFDALSELTLEKRRRNTVVLTDEEKAVIDEMRARTTPIQRTTIDGLFKEDV